MRFEYKKIIIFLTIILIALLSSCEDKLTEANISPNSLNAEQIEPGYVMTDVLSRSALTMILTGFAGNTSQAIIVASMPYVEQDQGGGVSVKNTFCWKGRGWGYRNYYFPLANSNYLGKRAQDSRDSILL